MEPGDTKFDASQYAFFGNNVLEEVEFGGLEDDSDTAFVGPDEEEYPPYGGDTLEDGVVGSLTDVDDLAGAFSKLSRTVNGPNLLGIVGRGEYISRQTTAS